MKKSTTNMAEDKSTPDVTTEAKAQEGKPAAKAKPAKPPKVEDKPFAEFVEQHFVPALEKALTQEGLKDIQLSFLQENLPLKAASTSEKFWQVIGTWQDGNRQFNVYFLDENIKGKKAFSCSATGGAPSTIESFMIDERRVTLDLMVLYTLQRLNGQKWLVRN